MRYCWVDLAVKAIDFFERVPVVDPEIFTKGADAGLGIILDRVDSFDDGAQVTRDDVGLGLQKSSAMTPSRYRKN